MVTCEEEKTCEVIASLMSCFDTTLPTNPTSIGSSGTTPSTTQGETGNQNAQTNADSTPDASATQKSKAGSMKQTSKGKGQGITSAKEHPVPAPLPVPQFISKADTTTILLIDARFSGFSAFHILHFQRTPLLSMKQLTERLADRVATIKPANADETHTLIRNGAWRLAVHGSCSMLNIVRGEITLQNLPWSESLHVVEDSDLQYVLAFIREQKLNEDWKMLSAGPQMNHILKSEAHMEWPIVVMVLRETDY